MAGKQGMKGSKSKALPPRYTRDFLALIDGRSRLAVILKRRLEALETDLGGNDALSYQQRSLTRRAIWIEQRLLELEDEYGKGCGFDADEHLPLVQALLGIYKALGLKRVAKKVPTLQEYLAAEKHGGETV